MSYKTERGNVAKKCLRFHAAVKMVFDYQSVTKYAVAASRQLAPEVIMVMFMSPLRRAPAGVGPLEVRFAHPVRLSPATHSQGHGRPCLQRPHPSRGFDETVALPDSMPESLSNIGGKRLRSYVLQHKPRKLFV